MAPSRRTRTVNSTDLLSRRARGIGDPGTLFRLNLKVLRGIILQGSRNFIKVWSKTSKSTIMYESGKIYFENYQKCYSCVHTEPQNLYKLPKRSKLEKFEDALLCQCPLVNLFNLLLFLTASNWLYRLSAETGEELQRVYLSSKHKFRSLSWDVSQEIFYVKSVKNKETPLARQAGVSENTVMHLAIFHVFPLQIVGILEITKRVFGNGITDAVLSQGVLAVSYNNKSVKLFSFEHILHRHMTEKLILGRQSLLLRGKTVGEAPFGIPVNIQVTDCPPVLFEVSCTNNGVQIGGHPWHYIYTPPQKNLKGTHHICSLKDVIVTSSGRTVKRRFQQLDDDPDRETFRMVEYDNELDILGVVVTNGEEGEGRAHVRLHDNQSGQLQRTVDLVEPWDETYQHELCFDKDTIIHIEQKNNNFCCHVYKLKGT
uniref:Ddb1 and cul4 associated factor 17 n=1 Tax=Mastacembelus armatus TaxID=205130 RepID=A0A7N8XDV6_9TELE